MMGCIKEAAMEESMINRIHRDGHALKRLIGRTEREAKKSLMKKESGIRNRLRGIDNEYEPTSVRTGGSGSRSWKNDKLH